MRISGFGRKYTNLLVSALEIPVSFALFRHIYIPLASSKPEPGIIHLHGVSSSLNSKDCWKFQKDGLQIFLLVYHS